MKKTGKYICSIIKVLFGGGAASATIYTINNSYNLFILFTEHVDITEHQRHIQEVTVPSEGQIVVQCSACISNLFVQSEYISSWLIFQM